MSCHPCRVTCHPGEGKTGGRRGKEDEEQEEER
ncbi:hypothetical protein LEMLEM_LOCUS20934, partial [Lemmus lemmus]